MALSRKTILRIPHRTAVLVFLLPMLFACTPDPFEPNPVGPWDGWEHFHPKPVGYKLRGVWAAAPTSVWAVGDYGMILHWDGRRSRQVDSPTTRDLVAIDGRARDDIFAAGGDEVLRFGGGTWSVLHRFDGHTLRDLHCAADGTIYVTGTMGSHRLGGDGWTPLEDSPSVCDAVWTADDGILRVTAANEIWRLEDRKLVFEQELPVETIVEGDGRYLRGEIYDEAYPIYRRGEDGLWEILIDRYDIKCVADIGEALISTNTGLRLVAADGSNTVVWLDEGGRWIYDLMDIDGTAIAACGHSGTVIAGTRGDDGYTWHETSETPGYSAFNCIDGTACDDIWAGEWWGRVHHFDGETWRDEDSDGGWGPSGAVSRIQALDDGGVLALTYGRLHVRDPEGGWDMVDSPPTGYVRSFWGAATDSIFIYTIDRRFYRWSGGGWQNLGTAHAALMDITGTAGGSVFALTHAEPATLYAFNGFGFVAVAQLPGVEGFDLHGSRTDDSAYIGGVEALVTRRGVVYHYRDGNLVELTAGANVPPAITKVSAVRPGLVYAIARNEVWRMEDDRWSREIGLPPEQNFEVLWSHPDCGTIVHGHTTFIKPIGQE